METGCIGSDACRLGAGRDPCEVGLWWVTARERGRCWAREQGAKNKVAQDKRSRWGLDHTAVETTPFPHIPEPCIPASVEASSVPKH